MNVLRLKFKSSVLVTFFAVSLLFDSRVWAVNPEREFVMSCTYGVLAGTLVGAASLAFTDNPGENLQRVARGASIGLYIGIGLGFYTVYLLPKQLQKEEDKLLDDQTGGDGYTLTPKMMVFPLVSEQGIDGVGAYWQVARF